MKKIMIFTFFMFLLSFNMSYLKADCDDAISEAAGVYEQVLNLDTEEVTTVRMNINNLGENVYIMVLNDYPKFLLL